MGHRHAPAPVKQNQRDHEAAERFRDRTRQRDAARHPVGRLLHVADRLIHALAHHALEVEGLDNADALHGLLHDVHDAGRAVERPSREAADAPDDAAEQKCADRHAREGENRHERIVVDHHRHEPGQRDEIASGGGHHELHDIAHPVGREGQPGYQFGRLPVSVEGDRLGEQMVV